MNKISRLDDFWALNINGYITLFNAQDFSDATQNAKHKFSDKQWSLYLFSVGSFSAMSDRSLHKKIEKEVVYSIYHYFKSNSEHILKYEFEGEKARSVARTFIEACVQSSASKGLFSIEDISIKRGASIWVLREYYDQSITERILNKKRLAKKITLHPNDIEKVVGYSTNFRMKIDGEWIRITHEGIREP